VLYLRLIILSEGGDVPVDSETLLVTDFMNLKMAQSFRGANRDKEYLRVFIGVNTHTCISIYVYTVFLTKKKEIRMFLDNRNCVKQH
jgi:hypothetical protein